MPTSSPPTLICLHGAAGSHRSFDALAPLLSPRRRVLVPDLPGHGAACTAAPVDSINAHVSSVIDLLEREGAAVLAGHSMGGVVALQVALERPSLVRGLVLLGSGAALTVTPFVHQLVAERFEELPLFLQRAGFSRRTPEAESLRWARIDVDASPAQVAADFRALEGIDLTLRLTDLHLPALVLAGADDRMVPPETGRRLATALHAEFHLLDGAGHMLHQEQPTVVAETINQFLAALPPR